jgi:hypothetical protein
MQIEVGGELVDMAIIILICISPFIGIGIIKILDYFLWTDDDGAGRR